jgi:serine/threonine protein kinase
MPSLPDASDAPRRPAWSSLLNIALGRSTEGRRPDPSTLGKLSPEAAEVDLSDPADRVLGDYELLERLGSGGMGVVYRARQISLDREVAVKLLAAGPWTPTEFIDRFRSEARSAARMRHPSIVPIHEIGAVEDRCFYSMQLIEGETLAQRIARQGPLPIDTAARWLRELSEAVDYAHRFNVLHLDLKPSNILIDRSERVYVADFGLARPLDHALAQDLDEVSGTPAYMAPEQAQVRKHRLSPATDIYGLGAVLYEMLTGLPPVIADSVAEAMRQVIEDAPTPPRRIRREVPRDLQAVCLKCLAKEPGERYTTGRELADDLMRFLDRTPVMLSRYTWWALAVSYARRNPVSFGGLVSAGASVGVLITLLCAFWFLSHLRHEYAKSEAAALLPASRWGRFDGQPQPPWVKQLASTSPSLLMHWVNNALS